MQFNVCVIPARGGSKRIPRKNIRPFRDRPMIAWSIAAAQASGCFKRILVSTDDDEIAILATSYGAEVPFLRPSWLADDHATTQAVMVHAVNWCEKQGLPLEAVCCLYATAPFVQPSDLVEAIQLLKCSPSKSFVFPATSFPYPIQRAIRLDGDGRAEMFQPDYFNKRSQDLEEAYHDAGQFYFARPAAWTSAYNLFDDSRPLILPRWRVQDIDTIEDWKRAEVMHQLLERLAVNNV